jgi:hypothetical protein
MLCKYAAETLNLDSIRELIRMGDDSLILWLALHFAINGGLEMIQWLVGTYEETILNHGSLILIEAIQVGQIDIVEWLMDSCKWTTYEDSPFHYALAYDDTTFSVANWLLKTGKLSNIDIESELINAIDEKRWTVVAYLVEICKANIDEDYFWKNIDWVDLAKGNSEDAKLFLRTLLPRVDFPLHISRILMNTSSSSGTFIHRRMVLDGMRVREKLKKLELLRTQIVEKVDLPQELIHDMLTTHLGDDDKYMGKTTNEMWASID